jgi:lysophospholipase L1-like esterase
MRKKLGIIYLVLLHLLVVLMLFKSSFIESFRFYLGIDPPEITQHHRETTFGHLRIDPQIPDEAVIFIGDSITEGLCVSAVTTPAVNFGIGNDTTLGALERMGAYTSLARVRAVVLAIGVNDLQRRSNEEILANYQRILELIPAQTTVVVSGVLPLGEEALRKRVGSETHRLKNLNEQLLLLARNRAATTFVDAGPELADSSGFLRGNYHEGDGVHLSPEGYAVWVKALQEGLRRAGS